MIPYQVNPTNLVALLPDGRVKFLHPSAKPLIDDFNRGKAEDCSLDDYILDAPLVDLDGFHLSAPAIAFIEITNGCNLRCTHCYAWSGEKREDEMSTPMICRLLDDLAAMGVLQVFLTGGEVFSHPDCLEIIRHARQHPYSTQIFTNGLLIDESMLRAIPRGQSFFISFDTADPRRTVRGKMDYDKLENVFRLIEKHGHVVRTAISVHSKNIHDVEGIFEWCAKHGFPRPQWLETHPIGRALFHPEILLTPDQVDEVIGIYRRCMDRFHTEKPSWSQGNAASGGTKSDGIRSVQTIKFCQALERATNQEKCGRSVAYIASDGRVFPCSNCMSNESYEAGNLNQMPFQQIWEEGFEDFRKYQFSDYEICKSCPVHQNDIWCQFRCPPLAHNVSSHELGCGATEYLRRFMLASNEYWAERKQEGKSLALIAGGNAP